MLLTETTTRELMNQLMADGIAFQDAKVLVNHGNVKHNYFSEYFNEFDISSVMSNFISNNYSIEIAGVSYTLIPDDNGIVFTIDESYKEDKEDMKLNIEINIDNLQSKIEELQTVLSRAKEIEDYPVNAELTIDEARLKEWITEDIEIEEVSAYADGDVKESVITIHL